VTVHITVSPFRYWLFYWFIFVFAFLIKICSFCTLVVISIFSFLNYIILSISIKYGNHQQQHQQSATPKTNRFRSRLEILKSNFRIRRSILQHFQDSANMHPQSRYFQKTPQQVALAEPALLERPLRQTPTETRFSYHKL
jgi:hypothetical protein